jgi:hypothetical protein
MIAEYIDSILMFAVGAYATAVAFGRLSPPTKDIGAAQQWVARYGTWFKIIGPLLILIALILAYSQAARLGR